MRRVGHPSSLAPTIQESYEDFQILTFGLVNYQSRQSKVSDPLGEPQKRQSISRLVVSTEILISMDKKTVIIRVEKFSGSVE